jgi:ribose transport system substrate-binding protein
MLNRRTLLGAISAVAMLAGAGTPAFSQDTYDIALISKGFQHQFWQAVKAGADQAGADLGANVTFEGPDNETQVDRQIDQLAAALSALPLSTARQPFRCCSRPRMPVFR